MYLISYLCCPNTKLCVVYYMWK
uniref:Uncharacterized protein n=1 Tax=Anguilla anguilla TaxID=7936 RepID=A0A0E9Q4L8_ANGAN